MQKSLLAALVAAGLAHAAPVGTLNIAGFGNVRISATEIDFGPFGGGDGDFFVTSGTLSYNALAPGTEGTIQDLNIVDAPPGIPLAPREFIDVGPFSFDLRRINAAPPGAPSCAVAPAPGGSCFPTEIVANTPFLLTQTNTGVTVSLSVIGFVEDASPGESSYEGLFTLNFTRAEQDTIPELLAAFGPGGPGFVDSSWSAQFTSIPPGGDPEPVIPEPGTWLMMGGALVLLGGARAVKRIRR